MSWAGDVWACSSEGVLMFHVADCRLALHVVGRTKDEF